MKRLGLDRFIQAQESVYTKAFTEIQSGRKKTHWMWFIFPQLRGLGKSLMSHTYGIADLEEAKAYLADPILGPRLERISTELLRLEEHDPKGIFGSINAMKLQSCMTLFAKASKHGDTVFHKVLQQYFDGQTDAKTEARLSKQQKYAILQYTRGHPVKKQDMDKLLQKSKRNTNNRKDR